MKLITEINEEVKLTEVLVEEKTGKKEYFIEGIFLQGNIQNRNGRVYPSSILNEKVESYITNYVKNNRAFGELGHPDNPSINLDRISHRITELHLDGDNWHGKAMIMNTPMGNIARSIMESGGKLGVSSRALGSLVTKEGYNEVQGDLHIVTAADIVADPSAPDAFVNGIMESREWICEGGVFRSVEVQEKAATLVKDTKKKINEVVAKTARNKALREQLFVDEFYNFISKVKDL